MGDAIKMKLETKDMAAENVQKIAALFPNCVTEKETADGRLEKAINWKMLKQMLKGKVIDGEEAYEFTWVGKKAAIVEANKPIRKTLRPCKEESKNWDTTENLYIEGDNLEALKLLQESYLGKVKMIYIDPPYNTGHDFVYPDNFKMDEGEYNEGTKYFAEDGTINFSQENSKQSGKYHSDWCSMIYSRLLVSRNLLTDNGVIFISIDDNEVDNTRKICDEVFGSENFLACFPRITKKSGKTAESIAKNHDYVLAFSKSVNPLIYLPEHNDDGFKFEDEYLNERGKYKLNQTLDYDSLSYSPSLDYPIEIEGEILYPGQSYEKYLERKKGNHARADWAWRWSKELFEFGLANGFIVVKKGKDYSRIYTKTYQNAKIEKYGDGFSVELINRTKTISSLEFVENQFSNDNSKKNLRQLFDRGIFDYSKPVALMQQISMYLLNKNDIVLDFFSGSATTAHAVMQLNAEGGGHRKFIMVQLPEPTDKKSEAYKAGYKNICEIGKERIRRAGDKIVADNADKEGIADLDIGFRVLKVDSSNMNDVYYGAEDYSQQLLLQMEDNIKSDRTELDLLFGCIVDWGLELSCPYASTEIEGYTVHNYNDGDLVACFAENIPESVIKAIAKMEPMRAVFRDSGFADSPAKINVTEIFKRLSPDTDVRVI